MPKFKIEIQITLLTLIIGFAVVASGYLAYNSLSVIVSSIHREAVPDNRLFLMKNLASDLATLENNARLYILTDKNEDLKLYTQIQQKITSGIETLQQLPLENQEESTFSDSICTLAKSKIALWEQILVLHHSAKGETSRFTEVYSKLEEQKLDTIQTETEIKERGFLFFKRKVTVMDTTIIELQPDKTEILQEIQTLENVIKTRGEEINILESHLIEKNLVLVQNINQLIAEADQSENEKLLSKTKNANQLAAITYKRLAVYTIAAVFLLFVVLFVLFRYLRKSRNYELALKQAKIHAEELATAKEIFTANVTHELRTPVNAIYGLAEQLRQKPLDENTKEMVSVMAKSATHLKNVVNDTLDFTKMQSGKLKLENKDFSPENVFNEVVALQKHEAEKRDNTLIFKWTGEQPDALTGDPMRLKQILINLIGNAIKFTQNGAIKLEVDCTKNENRYHFTMVVSDTGIGISPDNLKIIFDEYVQAENTKGAKTEGTGLGLSIVKKLVELQNGTISIESETGKGTQIKIKLSYPKGNVENNSKNEFDVVKIPPHFKNYTYLIADDTEYNRFMIKGLLYNWGVRFFEATNGKEAVKIVSENTIDVVLMDLRMPEKNGIEATLEILKLKPETTIIAVSASGENKEKRECINAGMAGFLLKPFSEKELSDMLNSTLKEKPGLNEKAKPKINLSELERLSNGDSAFLKDMILLFISSVEKGILNIEVELKNNRLDNIEEAAHKMAAPCKHLQADSLYNKIKTLEKLAQVENSTQKLEPAFLAAKSEFKEIIVLLKNYLEEIPN